MKKLYCSLRAMFTGLYSSLGLISGSGFFLCVFSIVGAYFCNGLFSGRARGPLTFGILWYS